MSTKTPYEIRLELLLIAKDYLQRQHEQAFSFAMTAFQQQMKLNQAVADDWKQLAPPMFTIDDIVKQATTLGNFVNNIHGKNIHGKKDSE